MNNLISAFSFTKSQILSLFPTIFITLDLFLTSTVSKIVLASSYGFMTTLCGKIYCNEIKN